MEERFKKELIEEAKNGNIASFTYLFESMRAVLYAKSLQYFGYNEDARDVLQDVFLTAFSKINQLQNPEKFSSWIYTILKNQCLLVKRDQKKHYSLDYLIPPEKTELRSVLNSTETLIEKEDLNDSLCQFISLLEENKRVVLLLRFFSEYNSYHEISKILDIPVGTVRSRLAHAKTELQRAIKKSVSFENDSNFNAASGPYHKIFQEAWQNLYNGYRDRFLSLFDKHIHIRFSSGKKGYGLNRWAAEWDIDLETGVRFKPNYIVNAGNLAIVEGPIINPPDKPDYCPPEGGLVFFHKNGIVHRTHVHYAPRQHKKAGKG